MSQEVIADDKVVSIHYTLTNADGDKLDSSDGGAPLAYLHGHQNIVPGLEKQLAGKTTGDSVVAVVPPEEGYGERIDQPPQAVDRSQFPDDVEIVPQMSFMAQGPNGQPVRVFVTRATDEKVFIDTNHPLAGEELHFDVEIVDVRDASDEELSHGHVHGPGGHDH